jgi:putative ABC transport system permease protein
MAQSPGVAAAALAALALGIGANTVIFSVVYTVLLKPLPVRDPAGLLQFRHYNEQRKMSSSGCSYADVADWRRELPSFESIAALQQAPLNLTGNDLSERVQVSKVNANFFPLLGVRPALGRDFLAEEDRPGAGRVALLGHELWKRSFGANPGVAGATAILDGDAYTVIGVLPEGFRFVGPREENSDLYVPLALAEARGPNPVAVWAFGRLKPGVSPAQLRGELDRAGAAILARTPRYKGNRIEAGPIGEWIVPDVRTSLWVLLGAVILVLLIGCANVAGLLVARAAGRRREMAIRAALGAGRGRLVVQLLAESLPLGLAGGALGLLLAWWGIGLLPLVDSSRIPRLADTRLDGAMLALTVAVSILTCVLFSLAPALDLARTRLHETLKEGGRGGAASARGVRLRSALVVAEIAIALVLAVGAVLMIRTFRNLTAVRPGFNPDNLLTASVELPRTRYKSVEQVQNFHREAVERIRAAPGVTAVSVTNSLPLGGNYFRGDFRVEGREYASPREYPILDLRVVDRDYLKAMQIRLVRGRFFDQQDRLGAPLAALINQAAARRLFDNQDPIGQRIGSPGQWFTVIGMVADIRHTDVSQESSSEVLIPFEQLPAMTLAFTVRLDPAVYADPMRFAPQLRRAVESVDRTVALHRTLSMERIMADRLAPRRLNMVVLLLFTVLALTLAAVGVYGVLAYSVERRTQEIGIRMALGAERADVVGLVARESIALAGVGTVVGLAAAAGLTRLASGLLFGVTPLDPIAYLGAAACLMGVAALASYIPARRAARLDPIAALRYE